MGVFALGGALGALVAYFFDPSSGTRRRHTLRDRTLALFRSGGRQAARTGRGVAAEAYGVTQKVQHLKEEPKDFDDSTLAAKIRSEVFRDLEVPKGQINVNVQRGVVQLRGEVSRPELIDELVEQTRNVQGVRAVENLLHVPGTKAPMHE
ncbi:MAG TPA: BON domain-containing protein [Gaiellaceae bacterium]